MYQEYRSKADFWIVYIREAHPSDGWQVPQNERQGVVIPDPKTEAEREAVAGRCVRELGLTIPAVFDGMDNKVNNAYAAWPDRIYVVGTDGKIVYQGEFGPRGFQPADAKAALVRLLNQTTPTVSTAFCLGWFASLRSQAQSNPRA